MDIGEKIAIYGWKKETDAFLGLMVRVWRTNYAEEYRNVEQLLISPVNALGFCWRIRTESKLKELTDEDILQQLINLRKRKLL